MTETGAPRKLNFGSFTVDLAREAVLRDGEVIGLRPQSYRVLHFLLERRGRLVTKAELFEAVWGNAVVTDDSLTQCLVEIRKALGKEGRALVQTVPRRGYRFEGTPQDVTAPAPSPAGGTESREQAGAKPRSLGPQPMRALSMLGVVLAVAVITLIRWYGPDGMETVSSAVEQGPVTGAGEPVVAVLPFQDYTPEGDSAYLGYGLAEEILNRLAQVRGLRVVARTSGFAIALDESMSVAEIGRRLGATHLVEGSFREQQGQVRVTAQLIEAQSGHHLWSHSFDRPADDLLRLQDQIAAAVAGVLRLSLLHEEQAGETLSAEEFDTYLRASHLLRAQENRALTEARELLESVYQRAPGHLATAEKLLHAYKLQALVGDTSDAVAAARIGALADSLGNDEAAVKVRHRMLGELALTIEGDLAAAAEHLNRALSLSPEDPAVLRAGGELARALGRHRQAADLLRAALAVDPLCGPCYHHLAYAYMAAGQLSRAERALQEFMKIHHGGHFSLALVKILQQEFGAAAALLETDMSHGMQRYRAFYRALLLRARGDLAAYRESTANFEQRYADSEPARIAQLHAWGGNAEAASDWAQLAWETQRRELLNSLQDPVWSPLRLEPRFLQLLERLGRAPEQLDSIAFARPGAG